MRGAHLGCGTVILPGDKLPESYQLLPSHILSDPAITWDNVDRNPQPGVSKLIDLFNYPWVGLDDNAYDYAVCSHLVEHIPHDQNHNGVISQMHPDYQDGWFAFFSEAWRILKPGGKLLLAMPYAWSNSGISDPTHTRYATIATMAYFNNADGDKSSFAYKMGSLWEPINFEQDVMFHPHILAQQAFRRQLNVREAMDLWLSAGTHTGIKSEWYDMLDMKEEWTLEFRTIYYSFVWMSAQTNLNMIPDFSIVMTAKKDADQG
jgi:SAM-dependent methyltransferase